MYNNFSDYPQDPNAYIMHGNFKYKARKWVNGKWQYVYDDVIGVGKRRTRDLARSAMENYGRQESQAYTKYQHAGLGKGKAKREWETAHKNKVRAKAGLESAQAAYDKTLMGRGENAYRKAKDKYTKIRRKAKYAYQQRFGR